MAYGGLQQCMCSIWSQGLAAKCNKLPKACTSETMQIPQKKKKNTDIKHRFTYLLVYLVLKQRVGLDYQLKETLQSEISSTKVIGHTGTKSVCLDTVM